MRDNNGYRVKADSTTLAARLKSLGFATGAFVGGFPLDQRFGLNAGFDAYDDRIGETGSTVDFALPERRADVVVSSALAWTGAQTGKWFAWVHVFDPHAPYAPPDEFARRYPTDPYAGEVAWTDYALGAALRSARRAAAPDARHRHRGSRREPGRPRRADARHLRLRADAARAADRCGARGRGTPRPDSGIAIDASVRHVDVVPTILEAVGAPAVAALPGASLVEMMRRGGGEDRPSYFEAMTANLSRGWAPLRGVIVGRDKYIDLPAQELYALDADAREERNLAARRRRDGPKSC